MGERRFIRKLGSNWLKRWLGKFLGRGSELRNSSGVSISDLLKLDMVLKTVWVESSESMRGELEKLGKGEEGRSERKMREEWRGRFDG